MAGADVQVLAALYTTQRTCTEGNSGVSSLQASLAQPLPVLGVFNNPDNFGAVALIKVVLAID